jgi:hypothetical protein
MLKLPALFRIFAVLILGATASGMSSKAELPVTERLEDRMNLSPETLIARSREEAALRTGIMKRLYNIGSGGRWDVDLKIGTIRFTNEDSVVTAPVQVIGTYNQKDGTWLWGWDHPSVPPPVAQTAKLLLAYGKRHGLDRITTRKIACTEEEAWEFTSMASTLSGAQGLYRGPAGSTLVFMTFGTVTLEKRD